MVHYCRAQKCIWNVAHTGWLKTCQHCTHTVICMIRFHIKLLSTKNILFTSFEVFLAMVVHSVFFWVVTLCSLMSRYQRFRGTCCLHLQGTIPFGLHWAFFPVGLCDHLTCGLHILTGPIPCPTALQAWKWTKDVPLKCWYPLQDYTASQRRRPQSEDTVSLKYKSCILLRVQNSLCTKWLDCSAHVMMLNCIGIRIVWCYAYLNTFQVWNIGRKLDARNIIQVVIDVLLGTFNDTLSGGTHGSHYWKLSDYLLIEIG
jgi:hypothetical protein